MDKDKIVIKLYEILTQENRGVVNINKVEDATFDDGLEQGQGVERVYFEREIRTLIKEIKNDSR